MLGQQQRLLLPVGMQDEINISKECDPLAAKSLLLHPKLERRISFVRLFVRSFVRMSRSGDPPLKSETGLTGELWSNCVLLILEN